MSERGRILTDLAIARACQRRCDRELDRAGVDHYRAEEGRLVGQLAALDRAEDAEDLSIGRAVLAEIRADPSRLISGAELDRRLAVLRGVSIFPPADETAKRDTE